MITRQCLRDLIHKSLEIVVIYIPDVSQKLLFRLLVCHCRDQGQVRLAGVTKRLLVCKCSRGSATQEMVSIAHEYSGPAIIQ